MAMVAIGSAAVTNCASPRTEDPAPISTGECWVELWEDENYQGDNDRITQAGRYPNMRNLPGANTTDWGDEIDSIKLGSGTTVKLWEDEEYKDNSITIGPGGERTNLRGSPDMGDTVDAMEITCS